MRHYEIVFFVHPDQSTQVPSMVERYKKMVTDSGGKVHRCEDWGRRRLAHPVAKVHKAHYILLNIECGLEAFASIQHSFRFNDAILRNLIVVVPNAVTEPSPMAIAKKGQDEDDKQDSLSSTIEQPEPAQAIKADKSEDLPVSVGELDMAPSESETVETLATETATETIVGDNTDLTEGEK